MLVLIYHRHYTRGSMKTPWFWSFCQPTSNFAMQKSISATLSKLGKPHIVGKPWPQRNRQSPIRPLIRRTTAKGLFRLRFNQRPRVSCVRRTHSGTRSTCQKANLGTHWKGQTSAKKHFAYNSPYRRSWTLSWPGRNSWSRTNRVHRHPKKPHKPTFSSL